MGFYSEVILPKFLDSSMSQKEFEDKRSEVLAKAKGMVLEIGSGSGLNFKHYPNTVTKVYALDNNPGMQKLAQKKVSASTFPIEFVSLSSEQLPFEAETFDTVVSTWTLCSIDEVEKALGEIRRVLKPDGKFIFIEHGLAPDPKTQVWQHRLTPIQKKLVGNCRLDRAMRELIEGQAFKIEAIKEYYVEKVPKITGYLYEGIATRA